MSTWQVRKEGAPEVLALPSAAEVLTGLRDGNFLPTDEVRGPGETAWRAIEAHPTFAEAAAEVEPPKGEGEDDSHLDMNPLIDVCLVLLIFFILTITYASVERVLDMPHDTPDEKKEEQGLNLRDEEKKEKKEFFVVKAGMDGDRPVIRMGPLDQLKEVPREKLSAEMKTLVAAGRTKLVLDIDPAVPWGIEAAILDAAKGNNVREYINNTRPKAAGKEGTKGK